ncbi:hypothetical protein BLNAU_5455 [Blattamonas nauphoetae]|uniref:Uncharacterized protein n=1 Tax=Blattamonas nauphoetae TaxID=2049346 RepID=A0ABQ9Y7K5_9EUKA|nr:hypothetical protein BLNAU_5455 [Blattamonas nauphoetae]
MNYDNRNRIIAHYADNQTAAETDEDDEADNQPAPEECEESDNQQISAENKFSEPNQASELEFIFANKTGLAAAKIAEICFTPLHLSLLRLLCSSAVDFGSDSVTFVGSAIHFAYTLLSQPLSSHSFEGCDAKEQLSLATMLRTSDASCARCFKNIVMHQRKHLDKESERGGRGKDGRRGGTERGDTETAGTRERAEGTRKDFATQQTDLQQLGTLFDRHHQHLLITPGELTAKEAIVIGGGDEAQAKSESDDDDTLRETSEDDSDEGKEASDIHPCLNYSPTARDALETNPESRPTQPKEGSDDENNRFNKQQKEGRQGRRRAERLRRKGRFNDLKQKTENSDTLEMLTEILMEPTVQTVAIKKQRDLSLVAARTIQKCFDGLLLKAIVDSELEKRGREASPELDTTSNTPKDIPPRSRPQVALRQTDRARIRSLPPACPVVRSVFAIEDDEVEGGRHQAAQTGRIAPRGGIGRGESDKDDEVKEPIPIVLQDIVSNILHLQTAQPDQTALQRQKRKRERRLRNELHTIFKEEEELSTSEEEQRRLAALKKDDDGLLNYNLPSEHPSHRPTPVPSPLNLRVMGLDAISVHPSSQLALSEDLLNQHNAFKPQFTVDRLLSELRHASRSTSAFFFSRVGPLFTRFFPKHRLTLSQQIQRDCIRSEKPNRRGPHNAKTIVKRKDIQLLIWVVILHWLVFARHQHKEEFTGRDNSQMLDEKVETAPSEDEKPKSKASAKLSKSPAKEKKGKEE